MEARGNAESESGKTNQILKKTEGSEAELRLTFSAVASSCTFSDFSNQRWVIWNFSSKMSLGFYSRILTSLRSFLVISIILVNIVLAAAEVGCFSSLIQRSRT